jgi:hypothetical protein
LFDWLRTDKSWERLINLNSLKESTCYGEPGLRNLKKGERIQVLRKGYFIVDSPFVHPDKPIVIILIPDGTPPKSNQ